MYLILLMAGVIFCVCWLGCALSAHYDGNRKKEIFHRAFINGSFLGGIISAVVVAFTFLLFTTSSYSNYLDLRAFYDSTIEQYATAVEMYQDKAVIDVEKAAFTDLKYQGYQDNIHNLILDLRGNIVRYNQDVVSKRIMSKNPWFSWIIVGVDDDMKLMAMRTANTRTVKE